MSVPSWGFNLSKSRRGHPRTLGLGGGQALRLEKGEVYAKDGLGRSPGLARPRSGAGGQGRPSPYLKYWMPTISHQARARSTARPSGSVHWREAASVSTWHTPHPQPPPGEPQVPVWLSHLSISRVTLGKFPSLGCSDCPAVQSGGTVYGLHGGSAAPVQGRCVCAGGWTDLCVPTPCSFCSSDSLGFCTGLSEGRDPQLKMLLENPCYRWSLTVPARTETLNQGTG